VRNITRSHKISLQSNPLEYASKTECDCNVNSRTQASSCRKKHPVSSFISKDEEDIWGPFHQHVFHC